MLLPCNNNDVYNVGYQHNRIIVLQSNKYSPSNFGNMNYTINVTYMIYQGALTFRTNLFPIPM